MTRFVEEDVDEFGAIFIACDEGEEDDDFWDGIEGAAERGSAYDMRTWRWVDASGGGASRLVANAYPV